MTYCTLPDLQLAIPAQTLIWLSQDDTQVAVLDAAVVGMAMTHAGELIDGYLRGRYALPLADVPTMLKDIAVSLARHWLYARRPDGGDLPKAVCEAHKTALSLLDRIQKGTVTPGIEGLGTTQPEAGVVKARSRESVLISLLEQY